jgi:hypothetical protein
MPTKAKTKQPTYPSKYQRVPVTDIVLDDDEMPRNPQQRYDWTALGDKAIALHKADPSKWQLVDPAGATSTASNITQGLIKSLNTNRFAGWKFRGRVSEITETDNGRRAKVWIKAEPEELVL